MIKSVIFDCFGVLAVDSWLPFKDEHFGHDPKLLEAATNLNKQANRGFIDNQEFITEIAQLAGVAEEVATQQIGRNPANKPLFDYIENRLKGRYKLGVLSNASTDWTLRLFTPDQLKLFDEIVLSYQTGFVKPDPRAYQAMAEKLDSIPEECVFIDDQPRHCEAAEALGFKTVLYASFDQFQADMNRILDHS